MINSIKYNLLKFSALIIAGLCMLPAVAAAQNVDIQGAACSGSGVKVTSDPSANACDKIDKNSGKTVNNIVKAIINLLTVVVGVLAVIMIIYAGFRYVSSGGNDDAVKGAKNTILYAIIGLVIVALAQIIVHFVLAKTTKATK
jgi:lysylphosphatidylglycerol synthetase-like protein (DUF2156 family)